jgi:DHA1 family tetracycline resistance protein-like MFS transporter
LRPLGILFLTLFTSILGLSILFPVLAPLGRHLGLGETAIGLTSAAYALAQLVFAPFWGRTSERWGRRPVLIVGVAGFLLGFVLLLGAVELGEQRLLTGAPLVAALFAARLVGGALSSAVLPTAQAYAADVTPPHERTRGMAVIGAAFGLSVVLGPGIGGLAAHHFGLIAPIVVSIAVGAVNLVLVLRLQEPERRSSDVRGPASASLFSRLRPLLLASFVITTAAVLMEQTIAFLYQDVLALRPEDTPGVVGVGLFAYGVAAVLTQGLIVRRVKIAPRTMILVGMPITALGLLGLSVADGRALLIAATALQGLGQGLVQPGATSLVSLLARDDEQGTAAGLGSSAGGLARLVGPLVGPALYELDERLPFRVSSALLGLTVVLVLFSVPVSAGVPSAAGRPK